MGKSIVKSYLRYKGEYDYHGMYTLMKNFFLSRDYDWYETKYKDKGNEVEVVWTVEREYDEYHMVVFKIEYHAWDMDKIDRVVRGKKKHLVRARIQLNFEADVKEDYNKDVPTYGSDKTGQLLKKIHGMVTKREYEEYWETLVTVMQHELMAEVKAFFGMSA